MEYISCVYDGSEKEVGRGYWSLSEFGSQLSQMTCGQIIGAEVEEVEITPLYGELCSSKSES